MRVLGALAVASAIPATIEDWVTLAQTEPEHAMELLEFENHNHARVPKFADEAEIESPAAAGMPIVTGHGMGDSCFNSGMKGITTKLGQMVNAFSVCVPTGSTEASDSMNGFFLGIPESIDRFAAGIRSHPELKNGFDAVGFSQGNSLIRGYIEKYNNPPVRRFLSVHGTVMGVASVPGCAETNLTGTLCKILSNALGAPAYTEFIQKHIFQAGYLRDPKRISTQPYLQQSELAKWNNEGKTNSTFKSNFATIEKFAMVMALQDTMVEPKEGEHWAAFDDKFVLHSMRDTDMYNKDSFGLKTVDSSKKIFFEETAGNHLQFSMAELTGWVNKYLLDKEEILIA